MPERLPIIRIFISSPSDVRPERLKAEQIIARLNREFAYYFHVEGVLWEREPLLATHHFQDPENTPEPHGTDIVIAILWSRLGVPLPEDRFRGAVSGRCPVTGTEWEFEDALASAREHGVPKLLLYRKTAEPIGGFSDRKAVQQRLEQLELVEGFIARWFRSADGEGLSAALHSFATTAEFEEQLYDHLYALLELQAGAPTEMVAIRWHKAPFRALLSYEYADAPIFFGRTNARNELRELLARQIERGPAFVLVFGASGSGKSSLVKAGVLPDLTLPGMIGRAGLVRWAVMRPSDALGDPLAALAAAIMSPTALPELAGLHYTPERLGALLARLPEEACLPIEQGLSEAGKAVDLAETAEARLVLVVDQLEEIFTIDRLGPAGRDSLVNALATLAKSGLVWVVATMRSDFFERLETTPALAALSADGRFLLLTPDEAEIGQIIRRPALEAGLRFEHDPASGVSLDEVIRQAAAPDRGALPLLSFLLDQLWQQRDAAGMLSFAAYRELGGLEGAIGRRAEEVFQAQPEAIQNELAPLLHELVSFEGDRPIARSVPLSRFPEGSPRGALVAAFLNTEARLLVSEGKFGQAQLHLAHEALLSHWPRARDQISADARDLELRGRIEREAERWRAAPRPEKKGRMITGLLLGEARALLARWGTDLSQEIRAFIAASASAARYRRWRTWGMVAAAPPAVAFVALVLWAGLVWWGVRRVEAELKFVQISAGCFEMGSPGNEPGRLGNEGPVHEVCVNAFYLGQYDVTQGQWHQVMIFPNTPSPSFNNDDPTFPEGERSRLPVEGVSWDDAQRFIWLMSLFGGGHYRLPSEAEWEYAARAGTTTSRYWGNNIDDACAYENIRDQSFQLRPDAARGADMHANCDDHYIRTAPVGSFKPNPWGLYDMLGNVANWVDDCYVTKYLGTPTDGTSYRWDPSRLPGCISHVFRGAFWGSEPRYVRVARRGYTAPVSRSMGVGFRIVQITPPSKN